MTKEQWAKLSDEKRRIRVAECDGWVRDTGDPPYTFGPYWYKDGEEAHTPLCLPDYLNDLNAMHAAEKVILAMEVLHGERTWKNPTWKTYCFTLQAIAGTHIHATAAQRAEAFVLTMDGVE